MADRVLAEKLVAKADQARGKFRSFLVTALDNFVSNQRRAARALKRSPRDERPVDPGPDIDDPSPCAPAAFDVAWAKQVLHQAVEEMREHCRRTRRDDVWGVFEGRVLLPTLGLAARVPYAQLVRQFNLESPAQASNVLITGNRMFRRALRSVVGRYERDDVDIDAEVADLRRTLARAGAGPARSRCT
jgi:RNA polymerase sigma-70 factor (ECF subfamily)